VPERERVRRGDELRVTAAIALAHAFRAGDDDEEKDKDESVVHPISWR